MRTLSGKKACWYPKICAYETWSFRCWCLCEVVGDWDVNKVVNYPIQNGDSIGPSHDDPLEVPSQSAPALPKNTTGTAVYCLGCHHCAVPYHTWLFKDGSFLGVWRKLCWRKAQAWACGYHDVFLWRDTPVYIHQCTRNWQWKLLLVWLTVSRLGDIYWRLIAGDL